MTIRHIWQAVYLNKPRQLYIVTRNWRTESNEKKGESWAKPTLPSGPYKRNSEQSCWHFGMPVIWYVHEAWNSSIRTIFQALGFICFCLVSVFFFFFLYIDHILNDKGFRTTIFKLDNTALSPVELEHLPMPGPSDLKQSFWFNWVLDRALATVFLKVPPDILMCSQYGGELL